MKYRILGISVIVGFIIILLPFFQSKETTSHEVALVKAPPFPVPSTTEDAVLPKIQNPPIISTTNTNPIVEAANNKIMPEQKSHETIAVNKTVSAPAENKHLNIKPADFFAKDITHLKNAVWVVQIGSFKNKANALRLVNQLRENGYRAFIQAFSGNHTRVFVGPENKRDAAYQLVDRLKSDLHIRGIVVSYQPFML
ncbi:MAG: SPOR domain-containing protein [Gammaproteobacteria bacterium]|nr:SPOR domain-containing protein [Gammaproteobacteria bacterium]